MGASRGSVSITACSNNDSVYYIVQRNEDDYSVSCAGASDALRQYTAVRDAEQTSLVDRDYSFSDLLFATMIGAGIGAFFILTILLGNLASETYKENKNVRK